MKYGKSIYPVNPFFNDIDNERSRAFTLLVGDRKKKNSV